MCSSLTQTKLRVSVFKGEIPIAFLLKSGIRFKCYKQLKTYKENKREKAKQNKIRPKHQLYLLHLARQLTLSDVLCSFLDLDFHLLPLPVSLG